MYRQAVDRRPTFKLTHVYWVLGTFPRRDGIHRPSIVVLARSSPLPEAYFYMVSRGRPLLTTAFVEECSCTLESLDIICDSRRTSIQHLGPHI